ncbi:MULTISPECIES: hypothetical protein [Pseudonocardia]|nr:MULTISPECIES: hypothetical protein [Pseudonocardia]BBF98980.1 hypothetical protein Pdca_01900 [Pseudonocardia autotrophica]GEC23900.1 hypothetical protein PSA01_09290 [Pseudonocardia saturnea]
MQDPPITGPDDDPPASPADALAIIEQEQARQEPDVGPYFLLWGVAWALMGGAWFGAHQGLWSAGTAGITTGLLVVVGIGTSAFMGTRIGRGVSGPSSTFGAMYGIGWLIAMIGTGALGGALVATTGPAGGNLIPALFVFVVGVLYTATGAFHRSTFDYVLGIVVQVIAVVTAFTPVPWNSLVMGIGGGGALIVAGLLSRRAR